MFSRGPVRWVALLAVPGLMVVGGSASADTDAAKDPKDARYLDIRWVEHGHGHDRDDEAPLLQHTIELRRPVTGEQYKKDGNLGLTFPSHNRGIRIIRKDGKWKAWLYKTPSGDVVGHPNVWRPNGRSFRMSFPKRWLEPGVEEYRWRAWSSITPNCPQPPDEGPVVACSPLPPDETKLLTHEL